MRHAALGRRPTFLASAMLKVTGVTRWVNVICSGLRGWTAALLQQRQPVQRSPLFSPPWTTVSVVWGVFRLG
jgi:hypothetical protein